MAGKAPFKVFLSSTFRDLRDEREIVWKAVDEVCYAIGMERFPADEKCSLEVCLENLEECNIYVGIIGSRYGSIIPEDQLRKVEGENAEKYRGLSFTHYEFRKAGELGIPRAVFIMSGEAADNRVVEFRKEIEASFSPNYFSSLNELKGRIEEFLREQIPKWVCKGKLGLPGFYGRGEVLGELYGRLTSETEVFRTVNVFGVGGIGKSALVEALLLLLAVRGYNVWEVRSVTGRETRFSVPPNYKSGVLQVPDVGGLAEVLGIRKVKGNLVDFLLKWLDENRVVLFIDDFQKVEDNFKEFIKKASRVLECGKVLVASRGRAKGEYDFAKCLEGLDEAPCRELVVDELRNAGVLEPSRKIVDLIWEKTKGHPLAVKMIVQLVSRKVLSVERLKSFGSIGDVRNEGDVKDFISRVFLENVRDELGRKALMYLSVLADGFDLEILRAIFKKFGDDRESWDDETLLREFLSPLRPHIIDYNKEGAFFRFTFSHDMVKEAAFSTLDSGDVVEARKTILECLKGREAVSITDMEIVYQAERLLEIVKESREREQLFNDIVEYAGRISTAAYGMGLAFLSVNYGLRAFKAALKVDRPIEALRMAENVIYHAVGLQLTEIAKETSNVLDSLYEKAVKMDESEARYQYAFAMLAWAIYQLRVLRETDTAEKILQKIKEDVIGGPRKRRIEPPLKWYNAYIRALEIEFTIALQRLDYEKVEVLLNEQEKLLNEFKKSIINEYGEQEYYSDMAELESTKADFMFGIGNLQEARQGFKNAIDCALKAGRRDRAAGYRTNLAFVGLLMAQNEGQFCEAVEEYKDKKLTLEDVVIESEDIEAKSISNQFIALAFLAQNKLQEAIVKAEEAYKVSLIGGDPYLIAVASLKFECLKALKEGSLPENAFKGLLEKYAKLGIGNIICAVIAVELTGFMLNKVDLTELIKVVREGLKKIKGKLRNKLLEEFMENLKAIKTFSKSVKFEGVVDASKLARFWLAKILALA